MFLRVEAILSLSPHLEVKFTPLVEEHLMNLVTDFSNLFSDVEDMMDLDNILAEVSCPYISYNIRS